MLFRLCVIALFLRHHYVYIGIVLERFHTRTLCPGLYVGRRRGRSGIQLPPGMVDGGKVLPDFPVPSIEVNEALVIEPRKRLPYPGYLLRFFLAALPALVEKISL